MVDGMDDSVTGGNVTLNHSSMVDIYTWNIKLENTQWEEIRTLLFIFN